MSAKLTLATGSHAGIETPLKYGYYMIGRDVECQIRPRSHSVSRRHRLLHHSEHGLRVFDLASANGTHVNDERLEANQWVWLRSAYKLRCGTVIFDVSVRLARKSAGPMVAAASLKAKHESDPAVIKQRASEDFDIASFLEAEDEAERQERYAALKSQSDDDEQSRDESQSRSCEVTSIDLVQGDKEAQAVSEEARSKAAAKTAERPDDPDSRFSARALRIAALRAKIEAERVDAERNDAINRALGLRGRVIKRPSPGSSSSRASVAQPKTATKTESAHPRIYAVVLLATLAGGCFIYSAYHVALGTPTHVIEEID